MKRVLKQLAHLGGKRDEDASMGFVEKPGAAGRKGSAATVVVAAMETVFENEDKTRILLA